MTEKARTPADNYDLDFEIAIMMRVTLDYLDLLPLATVEFLRDGLFKQQKET